jgi:tetratricopeptide (TPR) repeat protein
MVRNQKSQIQKAGSKSLGNVITTGLICLAIGMGFGYYLGLRSSTSSAEEAGPPVNTAVANPSAVLQHENALKAAIQSNPKDVDSLVQLGNLYYDQGRYRDAVGWYGKALELNPNDPNVRTDRGTSYWNLGQADEAIAEFEKSLLINPSHSQTLYNLGVVYLNGKKNPQEARKAWGKLLATNPDYPDRAKLQQEIAALSAVPEQPPAASGGEGTGVRGIEELLDQMKPSK